MSKRRPRYPGPGKPRLRRGEPTKEIKVLVAESDLALIDQARDSTGESRSEYVRTAALARAAAELGIEPLPED